MKVRVVRLKDGVIMSQWTEQKAQAWYEGRPWVVGCNYTPRTAVNQLEMWQADTFAPDVIREELGWARSIGMNSARVFLHDLAWKQDPGGFVSRVDQVLGIADSLGIGVMLVLFDSVWHPFPHSGKQREPEPGVHNSGWVQSPGVGVLRDEVEFDKLEGYVGDVISRFGNDPRVLCWDLWNEPDNANGASYGPRDMGLAKEPCVAGLLPRVFAWARAARPGQPLTSGVWLGDWSSADTLKPHEAIQLELSDITTFHCYGDAQDVGRRIAHLRRYGRPLLCTEYMSRGSGSTFEGVLPVFRKQLVGAYSWGLVAGRTQTNYPWDSWQRPYAVEPTPWFHEVFRGDGTPYSMQEVAVIRSLTGGNDEIKGDKVTQRGAIQHSL